MYWWLGLIHSVSECKDERPHELDDNKLSLELYQIVEEDAWCIERAIDKSGAAVLYQSLWCETIEYAEEWITSMVCGLEVAYWHARYGLKQHSVGDDLHAIVFRTSKSEGG